MIKLFKGEVVGGHFLADKEPTVEEVKQWLADKGVDSEQTHTELKAQTLEWAGGKFFDEIVTAKLNLLANQLREESE